MVRIEGFVILLLVLQLHVCHSQWFPNPYYNMHNSYGPYYSYVPPHAYGAVPLPCEGCQDNTNVVEVPGNGNQPNIIVINDKDDAARETCQNQELLTLMLANRFRGNPAPAPLPPVFGCCCGCHGCCGCNNNCNCCKSGNSCCNSGNNCCNSGNSCCNSGNNCCNSGNSCCISDNSCYDSGYSCCNSGNNCCNSGNICCNSGNSCCNNNVCESVNQCKPCGITTHITIVLPSNFGVVNKND